MRIANAQHEGESIVIACMNGDGWTDLTHALGVWHAHDSKQAPESVRSIEALLAAGRFDTRLFRTALNYAVATGAERQVASHVFQEGTRPRA